MGRYYMDGYTPPPDVTDGNAVREYQRRLGIKADGIWGPNTQAAYERSAGGGNVFQDYYESIMGGINIPYVSVSTPKRAKVQSELEAAMRPAVDRAIDGRKKSGDTTKAELDADAAARGMGTSTYVSSMKEREQDDIDSDISMMESQYSAALAEKLQSIMMQYQQMQLQADMFNAKLYQSASQDAFNAAMGWYSKYLKGSRRSASGSSGTSTYSNLTYDECLQYAGMLNPTELKELFYSGDKYWRDRRDEIRASLDDGEYRDFKGNTVDKPKKPPHDSAKKRRKEQTH